jgi:tetratricopeptide (TPR) repeat protein
MSQGKVREAQKLYLKVADYGNGYVTLVGMLDHARILAWQGKHAEARTILNSLMANANDSIKAIATSMLADSLAKTGEYVEARRLCERIIGQYQPNSNRSWKIAYQQSLAIIQRIEQIEKRQLICEPLDLNVIIDRQKDVGRKIRRRVSVRMYQSINLKVRSDSPYIKASILQTGWDEERATGHFDKEVIIEITPEATMKDFEATIFVEEINSANRWGSIPIRITVS